MTPGQSLLARVALAGVSSGASVTALWTRRLLDLPRRTFERAFAAAFLLSRFGLYFLLFFILHLAPRGDVTIYWEQALAVLGGQVVDRDFITSYAPLNPYLNAGLAHLWHSPLVLILLALLFECILLPLWIRLARMFATEDQVRTAALLYLCSAISLGFVAVDGQNNVIIAAFLAFALLLLARSQDLLSGFFTGLTIAAIKFLPLIYAPVYFLQSRRRWLWAAGLLLGCVPVYAAFAATHVSLLIGPAYEGNLKTAGNLPFLFETLFGFNLPRRLVDIVTVLALLAVYALVLRAGRNLSLAGRLRAVTFGMAATTFALILISKKSWPPYLMLILFPLCLAIPLSRLRLLLFAGFNIVCLTEPSVWATLLHLNTSVYVHGLLSAGSQNAILLVVLDLLLVSGYIWLLLLCVRALIHSGDPALPESGFIPEPSLLP